MAVRQVRTNPLPRSLRLRSPPAPRWRPVLSRWPQSHLRQIELLFLSPPSQQLTSWRLSLGFPGASQPYCPYYPSFFPFLYSIFYAYDSNRFSEGCLKSLVEVNQALSRHPRRDAEGEAVAEE